MNATALNLTNRPNRLLKRHVRIGLAAALLLSLAGCSRMFWRSQADFDTYNILMQKTQDPRWDLPRLTVEADPRSRFYDPFNLDRPPLPPDDPSANLYMNWVDGMQAYKGWHKFGDSLSVENPQWWENFLQKAEVAQAGWEQPSKPDPDEVAAGTVKPSRTMPTIENLTLEQAIELAHIHSRELQTQIENAYLSALTLTFDQFQFQVRYLGLNRQLPTSTSTYLNTPTVSDRATFVNRGGVSQLLPSGGQWVVELANNTLWLISGQGHSSSSSVLTYTLTQPLLLGAGRKIVLENLTTSERQVLYDVRTLARFRKIFFSNILVNGIGGAQGGIGYLDLLQSQQQVLNQRDNIYELGVQVERKRAQDAVPPAADLAQLPPNLDLSAELAGDLEYKPDPVKKLRWLAPRPMSADERDQLLALSENPGWQSSVRELFARSQAGVVTLELAQLLSRLATQINQLRNLEQSYLSIIDQFKLLLGLPVDFQMTIDSSLLKQFELIDPRIKAVEQSLLQFKRDIGGIEPDDPDFAQLQNAVETLELLRQDVKVALDIVAEDFVRVDAVMPQRLAKLTLPNERSAVQQDLERNRLIYNAVIVGDETEGFVKISRTLATLRASVQDPATADPQAAVKRSKLYTTLDDDVREELLKVTQNLKAVQAGLRSELITLQDFDLSQEEAVALAIENRLDLMNSRGAVMDSRRKMEVAANQLEAVLNIVARGDILNSPGNRPFDFRGERSTFQAGVQFTAPIDQVALRNSYRTSLVNFQRARRNYMELEDSIKLQVRTEWRQLQVQKRNFETSRQNLRISALQLDSAIETFNQPAQAPRAGAQPQAGAQGAQNQGLNLIQALQSVLNAQNDLISIWVLYEQNRINIYRDMDIMQCDERGVWIDPVYQNLGSRPQPSPTQSEPADDDSLPLVPPRPLEPNRAPLTQAARDAARDEDSSVFAGVESPNDAADRTRPDRWWSRRAGTTRPVSGAGRSAVRLLDTGTGEDRASLRSLDH